MFKVIHFMTTDEAAEADISRLFNGEQPSIPSSAGLGSGDYSRRPQALVVGRAFTVDMIDALRQKCAGSFPWFVGGLDQNQKGELLNKKPQPGQYGPSVAQDSKTKLDEVRNSDNWEQDGVYSY